MPPPPENVHVSRYRTHSFVKIRWSTPDSSILVTRYEIAKTTRQVDYMMNNLLQYLLTSLVQLLPRLGKGLNITLKFVLAMIILQVIGVMKLKLKHGSTKELKPHFHL